MGPQGMNSQRILLVIPCFNEQRAIAPLLHEITAVGTTWDTLVVDDGSSDETFRVASAISPTVRLVTNLGIGGAVQTGIRYAARHDFDFCVQIDGDGQHPPAEVTKLLGAYALSPRSIIVGSRYLENDSFRSTWSRRLGKRAIARTLALLFPGTAISDPTSGMRLLDRDAIRLFAQRYPHDFPEPISLAWARRAGLSVGEVAVNMRAREHGTSSIAGVRPIAYMVRVLGYIVLARISRASSKW